MNFDGLRKQELELLDFLDDLNLRRTYEDNNHSKFLSDVSRLRLMLSSVEIGIANEKLFTRKYGGSVGPRKKKFKSRGSGDMTNDVLDFLASR